MRKLTKALCLFSISILFAHELDAYCARCVKIESDRAKEQAAHPQPQGYYDDQITPQSSEKNAHSSQDDDSTFLKNPSSQQIKASDSLTSSFDRADDQSKTSFLGSVLSSSSSVYLALNDFFEESGVMESEKGLLKLQLEGSGLSSETLQRASVANSSAYSTLLTILKTKLLLETLDGSFTLFVPTDEALRSLPAGTLIRLVHPDQQENLAALVSNHVIGRKLLKSDFEAHHNQEIKAISGRNLTLNATNGKLTVDGAQVLRIVPGGYDGVIYIIDKVLLP